MFVLLLGVGIALVGVYFVKAGMDSTSTDAYCESCHVHPQATQSWKQGPHFKTASGVVAHCVDCHLPPSGLEHYVEKAKAGARDIYGYYFKDHSEFDWEAISVFENAVHYTFDSACANCHVELFPTVLTEKGVDAHLHYNKNRDTLRCINCHLTTGHFHEKPVEPVDEVLTDLTTDLSPDLPLAGELGPNELQPYVEAVPETNVRFEMVPIPGGTFLMGSDESDPLRQPDEGPQRKVQLSSIWMGKFEVSWREYDAFYAQTVTYGKNAEDESDQRPDAFTGPTPPYGSPDQGWGKGTRPAITMSHHAAQRYCEWLSAVTGRKYRLPTEAEWEYACRADTMSPYFFDGLSESWIDRWLGTFLGRVSINEDLLGEYAWYRANSGMRTHPVGEKKPNPWGLHNMIGSVREFCLDWYDPDAYERYPSDEVVVNPRGPEAGQERVIRGGSFKTGPETLRSSARDHTTKDDCLKTDPQTPKSIWWYSDCTDIGFRVVREFEGESGGIN